MLVLSMALSTPVLANQKFWIVCVKCPYSNLFIWIYIRYTACRNPPIILLWNFTFSHLQPLQLFGLKSARHVSWSIPGSPSKFPHNRIISSLPFHILCVGAINELLTESEGLNNGSLCFVLYSMFDICERLGPKGKHYHVWQAYIGCSRF